MSFRAPADLRIMRHPLAISLACLCLALPAAAGDGESDLAIYPGFDKKELADSTRAVLAAARTCAARATLEDEPETRSTTAPHLSAQVVDGLPVELQQRDVELDCGAEPVKRCTIRYAWAKGTDQVGYASVQCFGSHEDPLTSYLATATVDLRKAKKADVRGTRKDRASVLTSLTFQTDAFPGLHVTAFVEQRRRDGATRVPPQVTQFDDYATEDHASGALTGHELSTLAHEVLDVACTATRACQEVPALAER